MNIKDLFFLDKMLTPIIILILFWLGIFISVVGGLVAIVNGQVLSGVGAMVLGPLICRIWSEMIIVIFNIYKAVKEIADSKE